MYLPVSGSLQSGSLQSGSHGFGARIIHTRLFRSTTVTTRQIWSKCNNGRTWKLGTVCFFLKSTFQIADIKLLGIPTYIIKPEGGFLATLRLRIRAMRYGLNFSQRHVAGFLGYRQHYWFWPNLNVIVIMRHNICLKVVCKWCRRLRRCRQLHLDLHWKLPGYLASLQLQWILNSKPLT